MILIHVNIAGEPTDTPSLKIDGQTAEYRAVFNEDHTRATFTLPDSVPPHGATVRWDGRAARTVIPFEPGSYEGGQLDPPLPALDYAPPPPPTPLVRPVRVDGTRFVTVDDNQPWLWAGSTEFGLFKRYLAGEDLPPLLDQRRAAGARLFRVLSMIPWADFWFRPADHPNYYAALGAFADWLAVRGFYLEFTVYAGEQEIRAGKDHFTRCCDVLRGRHGVFIELGNEWRKNGFNPRDFSRPAGLIASAGSDVSDTAPEVFWDFFGWHGRRDWPKLSNVEDMYEVIKDQRIPGVHDEPIGAGEIDLPAYRTTSTLAMTTIAANSARLGSGATFHSQVGLRSELWGPRQQACAEAFFRALHG